VRNQLARFGNNLKAKEPVKASINPSASDSRRLIREALERSEAILIVGVCEILYRGRASSTLGSGERIVIITKDKALLIHRSCGYRAVNWQPAGCNFRVEKTSEDRLEITAVRMKPIESVKISFDRIYLTCVLDLVDESKICLYASESDMKKAIMYRPSLIEDGFTPITSEKEMTTGFLDILGRDKDGNYTIIETKRGRATRESVMQLARYVEVFRKRNPNTRGMLVAESLAKGAERALASLNLEFKRLSPKKCSEILREVEKNEAKEIRDYF
jgi:RecB family endonuclease NucS